MWCSTEDFEYYLEGLVAGCSGTFFTWTFFSWWCKDNEWFTANRVTKISGCETFGCWINGWADGNWSGWAFWTKSFDFFVQEVTICFEWWIESDTFRIPVIISEEQHRRVFQVCFFSVSKGGKDHCIQASKKLFWPKMSSWTILAELPSSTNIQQNIIF